jgi:hypothetical protein
MAGGRETPRFPLFARVPARGAFLFALLAGASRAGNSLPLGTRRPDREGRVAGFPFSLCGYVTPVGPVGPVGPVAPLTPLAPAGPVGPVAPLTPLAPAGPVGPVGPTQPGLACSQKGRGP